MYVPLYSNTSAPTYGGLCNVNGVSAPPNSRDNYRNIDATR